MCINLGESLVLHFQCAFSFCISLRLYIHFVSFFSIRNPVMVTPFRPKVPNKIRESVISSILPNMEDTFLTNEDMKKLLARFANPPPDSISQKFTDSSLLQASTFPEAFPCPKLVLACIDRYDAIEKCIHTFNGEILVYVNRVYVMGALRILP